jgi:hypothetical protein
MSSYFQRFNDTLRASIPRLAHWSVQGWPPAGCRVQVSLARKHNPNSISFLTHFGQLYKELLGFSRFDSELAKVCIDKLQNHLWPLAEENVLFCLASSIVANDTKRKVADAVLRQPRGYSSLHCYPFHSNGGG